MTWLNAKDLTVNLLERSIASVQVAAVVEDTKGDIFGWGWNSSGPSGLGEHAEAHTIRRVNRSRLKGATIFVAGRRKKSGSYVFALPCEACMKRIRNSGIANVVFLDRGKAWKGLKVS